MSTTSGPTSGEPGLDKPAAGESRNAGANGNGERRRQRVTAGIAVLVVIAAGVLVYWFFFVRGIVYTDDARFSGHLVDLAPEINGRLIDVAVREGTFVHKGEVVFRLDPSIPQAELNGAEASLVSARASLALSEAMREKAMNGSRPEEIKAAEATARRLQSDEEMAQLNYARIQALFKDAAVTQDDLDRARTASESARQGRENAEQNLALLRQGTRKEDKSAAAAAVELARSKVAEAAATVENLQRDLARCTVVAPFDAWVVRRWIDPGAMPLVAQPVVSLFDPATLRVDANIEEKYLHDVAIGDSADIVADSYPSLRLKGRVTSIMRATNSEFSLIPAEGVSGTFIKVTQRIPLRIAVSAPPELLLGPGLSVEVKIHSGSSAGFAPGLEAAHD
jgi:membrane fusion protein (multidrug efflux system)